MGVVVVRLGLVALIALVAGCGPQVDAVQILANRYPLGSSSEDIAETFAARRFLRVICPSDPVVANTTLGCGPRIGANSPLFNRHTTEPPSLPTCMVKPQQFFLATGAIVCWVDNGDGRIVWTHADWFPGDVPPLAE